jgi:hypothetical protein
MSAAPVTRFKVLERRTWVAPLGVRLLDRHRDVALNDPAIRVTARRADGRGPAVTATLASSGLYGFATLPGLRDFEQGVAPAAPDPPHRFLLRVEDSLGRFLPTTSPTDAPSDPIRNVLLFSAPTRVPPPGFALVRATITAGDGHTPAPFAVLEATLNGGARAFHGIADRRGEVALLLPYPDALDAPETFEPDAPRPEPLHQRDWPLSLRVRFRAGGVPEPPEPGAPPEIARALDQPAARFVPRAGEANTSASLAVRLPFGKTLVVRTEGASTLIVRPAP